MADSTSVLSLLLLSALQAAKEAAANNLFNAGSPAMLYANNPSTTTGLTWGYIGGRFANNTIANSTIALTAASTNYVVALRSSGAVSVSTATTNWNDEATYVRTYSVVTDASTITSYLDFRQVVGSLVNPVVPGTDTETVQDIVGALITAGSGVSVQYNDGDSPPTFVITSTGGGAVATDVIWDAKGDLAGGTGANTAAKLTVGSNGKVLTADSAEATGLKWADPVRVVQFAVSDETTALTTGTAKITFRMPYAMTLTAVRGSLVTEQTSGGALTVDINESGTTILSTKLTFDNTEKTTTTAATPAVISDPALADDAEITVDIDVIGDGTAKGLKITLIGY